MLAEAEENAEADIEIKQKVEAKNQLEAYLYNLRSSVEDTLKDKLEESDKDTILTTVKESLAWMEENANETKDAYDEKRKEVEGIANPIISKAYGSMPTDSQNTSAADDEGDGAGSGPTVEEVD